MAMARNAFGKSEPNEAMARITPNNLLISAHHYITSQPGSTSTDLHMNDRKLKADSL
jgi:hypothetical protein